MKAENHSVASIIEVPMDILTLTLTLTLTLNLRTS